MTENELAYQLNTTIKEIHNFLSCYAPRCNGHFVLRTNHKNGNQFFGCSNYPNCTATRKFIETMNDLGRQFIGESYIGGDDEDFAEAFHGDW